MWLLSSLTEEEVVAKIKSRSLQLRDKCQLEKEDAEDVCEATRTGGEVLSAASFVGAPSQEPPEAGVEEPAKTLPPCRFVKTGVVLSLAALLNDRGRSTGQDQDPLSAAMWLLFSMTEEEVVAKIKSRSLQL
jgi:hypothetical protein